MVGGSLKVCWGLRPIELGQCLWRSWRRLGGFRQAWVGPGSANAANSQWAAVTGEGQPSLARGSRRRCETAALQPALGMVWRREVPAQ